MLASRAVCKKVVKCRGSDVTPGPLPGAALGCSPVQSSPPPLLGSPRPYFSLPVCSPQWCFFSPVSKPSPVLSLGLTGSERNVCNGSGSLHGSFCRGPALQGAQSTAVQSCPRSSWGPVANVTAPVQSKPSAPIANLHQVLTGFVRVL